MSRPIGQGLWVKPLRLTTFTMFVLKSHDINLWSNGPDIYTCMAVAQSSPTPIPPPAYHPHLNSLPPFFKNQLSCMGSAVITGDGLLVYYEVKSANDVKLIVIGLFELFRLWPQSTFDSNIVTLHKLIQSLF